MRKEDLVKINDYLWEIPGSFRKDMLVPARIYADEGLLEEIFRDKSLDQIVNVATLRGIQKYALAMPDAHEGYGFPVGGVAATKLPDGVISPGGIGYDINCGVRVLKSKLSFSEIRPYLEEVGNELQKSVPSGVGQGGPLTFNNKSLDQVLRGGAKYLIEAAGYGESDDAVHIEANGALEGGDPALVSSHAKNRGRDQLGTIGAGNHFVEVQRVETIYDKGVADVFGLFENQIAVMVHTGSRGFGHQVATDYIRVMMKEMPTYGIRIPDRELACAPFNSPEGQKYFKAMTCAANFAWANRQMITHFIRGAWGRVFGKDGGTLHVFYDVAHNLAKIEEHEVETGKPPVSVCVHRKGATRAFGPGHPEVLEAYRNVGQPVLIPGSMGTSSHILAGALPGMKETFGTVCHGAGRRMSRHAAARAIRGEDLKRDLEAKGIVVRGGSWRGLAEEAPLAYKDVDRVVDVVDRAGIAKKVARLKPLVVVKG